MSDEVVMGDGVVEQKPLSEVERVVDAFVAPGKTFTDILRSTSWWLPFVLMSIVTLAVTYTIGRQVGWDTVYTNQLHLSPKQEEKVNDSPPEQRANIVRVGAAITKYVSYSSPVLILMFTALGALVLWGTFNFGLGAKTTYGQMFAVWSYAALPRLLSGLLTIVVLCFGSSPEGFNIKEPVGTNLAYYMPDAAGWLKAALGFLDLIGLWNLALLVIGTAVVAKVRVGSAAAVVVGWWLLMLLIAVGIAAATS
jgi:hypothetical protein